jgi:hypothetical protein
MWIVSSASRRISRHRWQSSALHAANRLAWRRGVDVNIHGRNGRIRVKDSHGNESPRLDR